MTTYLALDLSRTDERVWQRRDHAPECTYGRRSLYAVAVEGVVAPRDTLRRLHAAHPDFTDAAWCSDRLPTGFSWVGEYYPAAETPAPADPSYVTSVVLSEDRVACAHCAFVAASAHTEEEGRGETPSVVFVMPTAEVRLDSEFYPRVREISGVRLCTTREADWATVTLESVPSGNSCSNCGRPGHNVRSCTHPAKAHDRIGVEVEGVWADLRAAQRRADAVGMSQGCSDGSVQVMGEHFRSSPCEFQTKPGSLLHTLAQVHAVYPDQTNHTCGMHVHVSFLDPTHISQLNTVEFFEYFRTRWEAWGAGKNLHPQSEFFKRLRGDNGFCRPNTTPCEVIGRDGERYLQLNWLAWGEHKTLECRMLPMFQHEYLARSAITELIDIYEMWLGGRCANGGAPPIEYNPPEPVIAPLAPVQTAVDIDLSAWEAGSTLLTQEIEIVEPAPGTSTADRVALSAASLRAIREILAGRRAA